MVANITIIVYVAALAIYSKADFLFQCSWVAQDGRAGKRFIVTFVLFAV
jgi:hypothetical protein